METLATEMDDDSKLLYKETEKHLTLFADTVRRLCKDRSIPRATPVSVINSLWDEYMRGSTAIRAFVESVTLQLGPDIALNDMRRIGYAILNKVVDTYTAPCSCRDLIAEARKNFLQAFTGSDLTEQKLVDQEGSLNAKCEINPCTLPEGELKLVTPQGQTIIVTIPTGVYAVRDGTADGRVDQGPGVANVPKPNTDQWTWNDKPQGSKGSGGSGGNGNGNGGSGNNNNNNNNRGGEGTGRNNNGNNGNGNGHGNRGGAAGNNGNNGNGGTPGGAAGSRTPGNNGNNGNNNRTPSPQVREKLKQVVQQVRENVREQIGNRGGVGGAGGGIGGRR
jgi:hypothetical protein